LRIVCGVTSKRMARSSTLTRPWTRAKLMISLCRGVTICYPSSIARWTWTPRG
jgi:hypothetical protein